MSQPEGLWHIHSPDALIWKEWETEYTLFDRNSGETHLINELPAQVLQSLTRHPATSSNLATELACLCEVENGTKWQQQTLGILNNLASLDLIETQS